MNTLYYKFKAIYSSISEFLLEDGEFSSGQLITLKPRKHHILFLLETMADVQIA